MSDLSYFVPLQKVDEAKHEVWGLAAVEQPDRAGEILDYASSKGNFEKWSAQVQEATGGKSLGNVRAMHKGALAAVGKLVHFETRDNDKAIYVGARIVDEDAWQKVLEGVYSGFSVGGRYGKRWQDGLLKRYEAIPTELSLVDVPCIPGATFEVVKADGGSEMRKFASSGEDDEDKPAANDEEQDDEQPAEAKAEDGSNTESEEPGTGDGQGLTAEGVKEIVVKLLMELGLVQESNSNGQAAFQRVEHSDGLQKMDGRVDDLQKQLVNAEHVIADYQKRFEALEPLAKALDDFKAQMIKDLAAVAVAVETLEKRGGMGPVIREVGALTPQALADTQQADVLKKLAAETTDPLLRQRLEQEISTLEIKAAQTKPISI